MLWGLAREAAAKRSDFAVLAALASATRRGVPLDAACFAAGAGGAGSLRGHHRRAMTRMGEALRGGATLAGALHQHLPRLPEADHRAIAVAERRGTLPGALGRLAVDRRRELSGGEHRLAGPPPRRLLLVHLSVLLLFLAAGWLFIRLLIFPQFVEIFNDFKLRLPDLTRWVFGAGFAGQQGEEPFGLVTLIVLATAVVVLFTVTVSRALTGPSPNRGFVGSRLAWLWPPHRHRAWSAAFATTAAGLRAGADLPEAFGDAADASASRVVARRLRRAAAAAPDASFRGFPSLARGLLSAPGGLRPRTLEALAEAAAERAESSETLLNSVVMPGILLLVAVPVGLFALALFLPLVRLIERLNVEVFVW